MKAIQMTAAGGPEVLQGAEMEMPAIERPDQVRVRVIAAGVNPVDTKLRSKGSYFPQSMPAVLGCDGAGVVEAIGEQVTAFKPGDEVMYCYGGLGGEGGSYAEYAVIPEQALVAKPAGLDFVQAAALPLVCITAWESLFDRARIGKDQYVLIHGGAGGVGHIATQLARRAGARVCTTISSPEKAVFCYRHGVHDAFDYTTGSLADQIKGFTYGHGLHYALDTVGGDTFRRTIPMMAHYATLVSLLQFPEQMDWKEARLRNLTLVQELMLTPMLQGIESAIRHQAWIVQQCAELIASGELKVHVDAVLRLNEAAEAHRRIEQGGQQGKLVLQVGEKT